MVKRRTSGATLAPELEQALLALWPSQPLAARALWLQVLSTLLPPHTELLETLTDIEVSEARGGTASPGREETAIRSATATLAMTGPPPEPAFRDWRQTVGMFADDPIIDAITEAGHRIRAAERTSA